MGIDIAVCRPSASRRARAWRRRRSGTARHCRGAGARRSRPGLHVHHALVRLVGGRERVARLGRAQKARDLHLARDLPGGARRRILQRRRHEAASHDAYARPTAAAAASSPDSPAAGPPTAAGWKDQVLVVLENAPRGDTPVFVIVRDQLAQSSARAGATAGRCMRAACAREPFLPASRCICHAPSDTRSAKRDERRRARQDAARARSCACVRAALPSSAYPAGPVRPCWRYCSAISRPFSGRSMPRQTMRVSGSEDDQHAPRPAARSVISTHERHAQHEEAGEQHDEDGGPVARIGEVEIEPAMLAARRDVEEALEQVALAAARAAALRGPVRSRAIAAGSVVGHSRRTPARSPK